METKTEKYQEIDEEITIKLFNPEALNHNTRHRVKSIELSDEYTRIDFIYRSSDLYINGGWIQIDRKSFIRTVGSEIKHYLIQAINIPYTPQKHYFKKKGEFFSYSLIFPALPKNTKSIDIIEREAPGTYFNFYDVPFSEWMTVAHPLDIEKYNN